jgi:hypothetical protein
VFEVPEKANFVELFTERERFNKDFASNEKQDRDFKADLKKQLMERKRDDLIDKDRQRH